MRKNILIVLTVFSIMSCTVHKNIDFVNNVYSVPESDLGLFGYCRLSFINDSTLLYDKNGGNYYSIGEWKIVEDAIIFYPYTEQEAKKLNLTRENDFFVIPSDTTIQIKKKSKLIFDGLTYRKVP